ncbi:phage virion morphogenesis protein [Billgrantia gudaonensis]|uniref:Phage virion morphogenesis (Putative tail completion) protein n=1 Tax=Billgrantia gudaonensis TaxID=376427 RepID=A0A1G9DW24_9GAMM|nr:phage virion morphogenesis protein [Halomonas gudaonensis]SDK68063.1 phage virion morphogenesis (putative tail completion) protein [Halomonas gudaonensis]
MTQDDLDLLEGWVAPLLKRLTAKQRKTLAREMGVALRRSQRERIKAQRNVDGTPYTPRKGKKRERRARRRLRFIYEKPGHKPEEREIVNWIATPETYFGFDEQKAGALRTFKKVRIVRYLERDLTPVARPGARGQRSPDNKMFQKLMTAKYMRVDAKASGVAVGYEGRIARIARIHHEGLTDQVNAYVRHDYPERELLGATPDDIDMLVETILRHLDVPEG